MITESKEKRMFVSEETSVFRFKSITVICLGDIELFVRRVQVYEPQGNYEWTISESLATSQSYGILTGENYPSRGKAETAAIIYASIKKSEIVKL